MWAMLLLVMGVGRAETADEVIARARAANQVSSSIQTLRMTITRGTQVQTKEIDLRSRREADGTVKTRLELTAPSDVAGTAVLLIDRPSVPDEQYVYLPATKRTNRLSGAQRAGAFMGSDFSYHDLEFRSAAEGDRSITADTPTEWEITTKTAPETGYSKVVVHMSKAELVAKKVEFYDKEGALLKELVVTKLVKDGSRNVPVESEMRNVQAQKVQKTTVTIVKYQYEVGQDLLPDETFTPASLER